MPSRDSGSPNVSGEQTEKVTKNKPKASRLRQQKLPAWQPILTASTVIPSVVAVGVIFIPIGIALFLASESVKEYKVDYTDGCPIGQDCHLRINVTEDMEGDVYIYYYLENFYQNHRRYVKSRNDRQYMGNINEVSDCEPFDKGKNAAGQEVPIAPCGAIANSIFNDTYTIQLNGLEQVPLTTDGVLWDIDKNKKFKNPEHTGDLCTAFEGTIPPPNWNVIERQGKPCNYGGFENVDFIVWMRTAALPNFRKLWRIVDRSKGGTFAKGLPKGVYDITVKNRYPVLPFNGRKAIIFSTTSWAGGKNSFLGIAYLVVGCLAILLAIIFIVIHVKFGHSVAELSNIVPNNGN